MELFVFCVKSAYLCLFFVQHLIRVFRNEVAPLALVRVARNCARHTARVEGFDTQAQEVEIGAAGEDSMRVV